MKRAFRFAGGRGSSLPALWAIAVLVMTSPGATQAQPGTVLSYQKISDTEGNFQGVLDNNDEFGISVTSIGDFDGNGVVDIAVGAPYDDDGGMDRGAVWILFLNSDGTVDHHQKISSTEGGFGGTLDDGDWFGWDLAAVRDLDGDGVTALAVGAFNDDDGGPNRGAVWILFLNSDGTVDHHQKISNTAGGFTGTLDDGDWFGWSVARLRDLDHDGNSELVVGAPYDDDLRDDTGAVWILFLNDDGTVKKHQKISATQGGFDGALHTGDGFSSAIASLGGLDRDGVWDLAVGAALDDEGATEAGAVWILFLNEDGTVKAHQKISATEGGFTGTLDAQDWFGVALASLPDIDGDGVQELAVGACLDDDGFPNDVGAVWILFLDDKGTVKSHQKISLTAGGFHGTLDQNDGFGYSLASLGDVNGDGRCDLAVGALLDDDGGGSLDRDRGAVWVLFLDGDVLTAAPEVARPPVLSLASSPNPFRGRTIFEYELPAAAAVRLLVLDAQGRRVASLVDRHQAAGPHTATWSGRDESGVPVGAGIYFARLEAAGRTAVRKIVALK